MGEEKSPRDPRKKIRESERMKESEVKGLLDKKGEGRGWEMK